ncbi:hypothetical protein IAE22_35650, partial [Bacillus sp. S34]|nr:hypothetical protein [Bacillus sp. S34]
EDLELATSNRPTTIVSIYGGKAYEGQIEQLKAEGIDFQLNARTDAIARGGDRPIDESIADAIARETDRVHVMHRTVKD